MIRFRIEAWDVNCPQHIKPRFTGEEIDEMVKPLRDRIATLEGENAVLKKQLPEYANQT